jgi:hypothetical protein
MGDEAEHARLFEALLSRLDCTSAHRVELSNAEMITTFLMLEGRAEEAMRFYTSWCPGPEGRQVMLTFRCPGPA